MEQSFQARKVPFDIDALLHPSRAFRHPLDVVRDTDMTVAEKRSVLASWASDACAIESNPALRATATGNVVNYDDIIDARCSRSMTGSPRTRWPTCSCAGSGACSLQPRPIAVTHDIDFASRKSIASEKKMGGEGCS